MHEIAEQISEAILQVRAGASHEGFYGFFGPFGAVMFMPSGSGGIVLVIAAPVLWQ